MVKIGITTTIPYFELDKKFDNLKVLEYAKTVYDNFVKNNNFKNSDIILITNGYPWIDHLPVTLFLSNEINKENEYMGIELCMPTDINRKTKLFLNTHEGRSLNNLHNKYKEIALIDSLDNLSKIVQEKKSNKKSIIKRGFKQAKTLMVRNCDYVIVFGLSDTPDSEIWEKILCNKEYHCIKHLFNQ